MTTNWQACLPLIEQNNMLSLKYNLDDQQMTGMSSYRTVQICLQLVYNKVVKSLIHVTVSYATLNRLL